MEEILKLVKKTHKSGSVLPEGHYAGGIKVGSKVLSLATDGVGTKVLLAEELKDHTTIGIDCVAMNVNDLVATGSVPVAFVDYIAIRKPDPTLVHDVVVGLVRGCELSDMPLVGGETAVMPEVIAGPGNRYDVAGTALGMQEEDALISGERIRPGDVIIGIESSGIHSNGLTLARKLLTGIQEKRELLTPTRIYVRCVKDLLSSSVEIHGMAHITGGGFTNLLRLGTHHYSLESWPIPMIFRKLKDSGGIDDREMYRTFNMGIGFVVIAPSDSADLAKEIIASHFAAHIIGVVKAGNKVSIDGLEVS